MDFPLICCNRSSRSHKCQIWISKQHIHATKLFYIMLSWYLSFIIFMSVGLLLIVFSWDMKANKWVCHTIVKLIWHWADNTFKPQIILISNLIIFLFFISCKLTLTVVGVVRTNVNFDDERSSGDFLIWNLMSTITSLNS